VLLILIDGGNFKGPHILFSQLDWYYIVATPKCALASVTLVLADLALA
jgi:hypothetical protein